MLSIKKRENKSEQDLFFLSTICQQTKKTSSKYLQNGMN